MLAPLADDPNTRLLQKPATETRFQGNVYRDAFWAFLFVIQFVAMMGLAIYFYSAKVDHEGTITLHFSGKEAGLICLFVLIAIASSYIWLEIMKRNATTIIWITLWGAVALYAIFGIVCIAMGVVPPAIICFVLAVIHIIYILVIRSRIPFAATMLTLVTECIQLFPATIWVAIASMFVQAIAAVIWVLGVFAIYNNMDSTDQSGGMRGIVGFLLLVSFFWTSNVVKNVVHTTVGGTFASWYYLYPSDAMPASPVWSSFKRSVTTSFGSICLGSLIIAVVKALRVMAENGRKTRNNFVRCCIVCVLRCLDSLIEYFNQYAFAEVAIYGQSYCDSAKAAWNLLKTRGFDMLINDNIIGGVLVFGALLIAIIDGALSIVLSKHVFDVSNYGVWAGAAFMIALVLGIVAMEVVESCVVCCFVCYAEDPEALQRTKPNDYNNLSTSFVARTTQIQQGNRDLSSSSASANSSNSV
eukprot:TRINITY_DN5289_c0_g1_i1.p1 TRINITY_DN5289_c0_g1~~TRINITY_DN5289_c0_g1_i1.p1  ORF type:complete len:470 (+),score=73.21 TRINITY_DN5289_c0_g1_i1:48-1457(+)